MGGFRVSSAVALSALFALQTVCIAGDANAPFTEIPFDHWAASGNHSGIHWAVETPPPALSSHQRLELKIRVDLDLRELTRHKSRTGLLTFAQLRDSEGKIWRTRGTLQADTWSQSAFVLPGDYELELAAFDPDRKDYSFTRRKIHAASLKTDPLSAAWQNLLPVEWIPSEDIPDAWYLPSVQGRLNLPVAARRRVHLDVLLNATPAGKATGSVAELRRNMEALIPALKVISQLGLSGQGSLDVSLLDLVHQRVAFSQEHVETLNWSGLRSFFTGFNPGIVDVATLESSWNAGEWSAGKISGFFGDELHHLATAAEHDASGDAHAVIVLSGPAFFDGPKAPDPTTQDKGPDSSKVFYIRYRPIEPEILNPRRRLRPGMRVPPPPPRPIFFFALALDDLEKPLPPENSRIFDAISPEQFRRVLAAVIEQIGKL